MSVGGKIIEIAPVDEGKVRICVMDGQDETCVYAEPAEVMPSLGENVWWQSGKIMFDGDKRTLRKIGFSFQAPWSKKP